MNSDDDTYVNIGIDPVSFMNNLYKELDILLKHRIELNKRITWANKLIDLMQDQKKKVKK